MPQNPRPTPMNRRRLLALAGMASLLPLASACSAAPAKGKATSFPKGRTEAEWRKRLTPAQFRVLFEEDTERPYSSPLDKEKRKGTFACAACATPLYSSAHKFDSGTGWPSFWQAVDRRAIGTSTDYLIGYARTEVHCAGCGGHLGHIFDDGPKPTGKRHCINGVALKFTPA